MDMNPGENPFFQVPDVSSTQNNPRIGTWCDNGQYWGSSNNLPLPIGQTQITCKAWDTSGNTGSASFTITITESSVDTTPTLSPISQPFVIDLDSTNWNDKIWPSSITVDSSGNIYVAAVQFPNPQNPSAPYNDPVTKIKKY